MESSRSAGLKDSPDRAAFAVAQSGAQVAVLVPTTILAEQHFQTFKDRFAGTALIVEELSRFKTAKEQSEAIARLADGKIDINDAVQATLIMEQLMALAQTNNCCIVNVLHQNKSEADHNMRGSIGTELTNKAFEVFTCEYIEEGDVFKVSHTLSRKHRLKKKLYYQLSDEGLPEETVDYQEKPRDAKGRWVSSATAKTVANNEVKWEAFNQRYIHDHAWNIPLLFEDALENKNSRPYRQLMAATMRLGGIKDKNYFYTLLSEAEKTGVIQLVKHPENGETWVKLLSNQLPI